MREGAVCMCVRGGGNSPGPAPPLGQAPLPHLRAPTEAGSVMLHILQVAKSRHLPLSFLILPTPSTLSYVGPSS